MKVLIISVSHQTHIAAAIEGVGEIKQWYKAAENDGLPYEEAPTIEETASMINEADVILLDHDLVTCVDYCAEALLKFCKGKRLIAISTYFQTEYFWPKHLFFGFTDPRNHSDSGKWDQRLRDMITAPRS